MGSVFEARESNTLAHVAVKTLRPELAPQVVALRRFLREQRIACSVVHPAVALVFEAGQASQGQLYIVTEFVRGGDGEDYVHPAGSDRVAATLAADLFDGLAAAHALGVVHRDVKPANLLVQRSLDGTARGKLCDFGIASSRQVLTTTLTEKDSVLGTFMFTAPEQIRDFHHASASADVYAAAMTAYYLLSGSIALPLKIAPWEAHPAVLMNAHLSDQRIKLSQRRPDLPFALCERIDTLVALDAGARNATPAADIAASIRPYG